jgi:hypothetical protein
LGELAEANLGGPRIVRVRRRLGGLRYDMTLAAGYCAVRLRSINMSEVRTDARIARVGDSG